MFTHKIEKGGKKREVSEFAFKQRYEKEGWQIVSTSGKPMGSAATAQPLPPQVSFEPPEVLRQLKENADADAVKSDPLSQGGWTEPDPLPQPEVEQVEVVQPPVQKRRGRPSKNDKA